MKFQWNTVVVTGHLEEPPWSLGILRGKDWEMLLGKQNDQIYVLDSGNIMEDEVGRREVRGREIIWNIAVFVGVKMK